ncbi:PD-(D/E)XK motif protein [Lacibacter sp. H375]|uniref:PD-(D/E)XK motif protein n=1 Tax=Lacibacter sp. H375 TaxID=3133424 RepID=UPI0030C43B72
MKVRIADLWQSLNQQESHSVGFVKTLVDPSVAIAVYLALVFPNRNKALIIDATGINSSFIEPFVGKGMKLERVFEKASPDRILLMLSLTDIIYSEVFDVLLEDCISSLANLNDKTESLNVFANRLSAWKKLLETYTESGMSTTEQQGLFGELVILLRLLKKFPDKSMQLLTAWQGPDKFQQDFQTNEWAAEVKTTTSNDSVIIANESQLNASGLKHLFLWHITLDKYAEKGVTLNNLVIELKLLLKNSSAALKLLNLRLAAIGYFFHQSFLYEKSGYLIRQEKIYLVEDGFPSLTLKNIPIGINEVKYTLKLSACTSFITSEEVFFATLNL